MKKDRLLRIIGDISYESLSLFSEEIRELELESNKPIIVELCSPGGDSYAGIGFYSRISSSPCEIQVKVFGAVQSAATLILAAATHRSMHRDAWFMVHADSQSVKAANASIAISEAQHLGVFEDHWASILARRSKVTDIQWRRMSDKTTYLKAEQCLKLGLIDEIYR